MPDEIKVATVPLATRATRQVSQGYADDTPETWIADSTTVITGLRSYYEMALALQRIQRFRLYRFANIRGCDTFEKCCEMLFHISAGRAYQIIDYGKVLEDLRTPVSGPCAGLPAPDTASGTESPPSRIVDASTQALAGGQVGVAEVTVSTIVETSPAPLASSPISAKSEIPGTPAAISRTRTETIPEPTESQSRQMTDVPRDKRLAVWTLACKLANGKPVGSHHIGRAKTEILGPKPDREASPASSRAKSRPYAAPAETRPMVEVAAAALKKCNTADRTAAMVVAIEEMPVYLITLVEAALKAGKPGQFKVILKAYGYVQQART